jgi:hypothetical protein
MKPLNVQKQQYVRNRSPVTNRSVSSRLRLEIKVGGFRST